MREMHEGDLEAITGGKNPGPAPTTAAGPIRQAGIPIPQARPTPLLALATTPGQAGGGCAGGSCGRA